MIFGFGKKYFASMEEAKEFLIEKLRQEAQIQGSAISENERKFLAYSPSEPSTEWELDMDALPPDTVDERYEVEYVPKMSLVFKAACKRDQDSNPDPDEARKYRSATKLLDPEDYVIADIAREAFK
jgi:hypothetical protein